MTTTETETSVIPAAILEQVLALPAAARVALADRLDESLLPELEAPADPAAVKEAWRAEIARRVAEVKSGNYVAYTPEEVMQHVRESLRKRGHNV